MKKVVCLLMVLALFAPVSYAVYRYSIENQVVSVTTTATKLPTTPLVGRKYVLLQNVGTVTVYVGKSDVTADTTAGTGGLQLLPYAFWLAEYDHTVDIYGRVAAGTCNVAVEEGR